MGNIGHECVICKELLWQNPATESGQVPSAFNREIQRTDVVKLGCKHEFHSKCIEMWAEENPRCPLGRRLITTLPRSSVYLYSALLKSIKNNQIDDVRDILLTGMLEPGQLSALDQKNPLTVSLKYEHWDVAAEVIRAGVTTHDIEAQNTLGWMYVDGVGVEQNFAVARAWYQRAADQGHVDSQYFLASMYESGLGGEQNYAEAHNWYGKAANNGSLDAQNELGWLHQNGLGVAQSYVKALGWYRKAAEQGHAAAQNNMGWMYQNGLGVGQNYDDAKAWYCLSAAQENSIAQKNLDWMEQNLLFIEDLFQEHGSHV